VDVLQFSVTTSAATKFRSASRPAATIHLSIHYQVFSKSSGKLVADSDSQRPGDAKTSLTQKLQNGTLPV